MHGGKGLLSEADKTRMAEKAIGYIPCTQQTHDMVISLLEPKSGPVIDLFRRIIFCKKIPR